MTRPSPITGIAAGVPYTALPPDHSAATAPLVVTWHLMDPPCTDAAMAAALPMHGLWAWRLHLGLPMTGRRLPAGGFDELMRLGYQDAVLNLFDPIASRAVAEAADAVAEARTQLGVADEPVGVLGGSLGALVALEIVAASVLPVAAAAVVNPAVRLASVIAANQNQFGITYQWQERSRAVAARLDYVARAGEIAAHRAGQGGPPPVLVAVGELDDVAFRDAAGELVGTLSEQYAEGSRVRLLTLPNTAHALAEPPGSEPAPQTKSAATLDAELTQWFDAHLVAE